MAEHMLTTSDNPYNPFTHFDEWNAFDTSSGYHSLSYLARIIRTSDDLSDADQSQAIEEAITEIVEKNINGMYLKVSSDFESNINDNVTKIEDDSSG